MRYESDHPNNLIQTKTHRSDLYLKKHKMEEIKNYRPVSFDMAQTISC